MAEPDFIPVKRGADPDFIPVMAAPNAAYDAVTPARSPSAAAPAAPDQFAQDRAITDAWAQSHPILGPAARFLVAGGQSAMNAISDTPGQIYHAFADAPSLEEAALSPEQRLMYRMGGKQAIEAGQDYASGKVTPKAAISVLPEALGTGLGNVSGNAMYGKLGETAPKAIRLAGPPIVRTAVTGINQTLAHPEIPAGAIGAAVGERLAGPWGAMAGAPAGALVGRLIPKLRIPGENFGLPEPNPALTSEARTLPGQIAPERISPAPQATVIPPVRRGLALPERTPSTIEAAIESPARTLPGQNAPEVIFQPATPIPARSGLILPPAPDPLDALRNAALPPAQPDFTPIRPNIERIMPGRAGSLAESVNKPTIATPKIVEGQLEQALGGRKLVPGVPLKNQPLAQAAAAKNLPEGFTPVDSDALRGYKYNPATKEFEAITTDGRHYVHSDVSPEQASKFEQAESKGKAWNDLRKAPGVTLTKKGSMGNTQAVKPGTLKTENGVIPKAQAGMDLESQLNASLKNANVQKGSDVPKFAYRARDVGEKGIPLNSGNEHAHATSDFQQATKYAEAGQRSENPGGVVRVDLSKLKPSDYVIQNHPSGAKWVKFTRPLTEDEVSVQSGKNASAKQ